MKKTNQFQKSNHYWRDYTSGQQKRRKFSGFNPTRGEIKQAIEIFLKQGGKIMRQSEDCKNIVRIKTNEFESLI